MTKKNLFLCISLCVATVVYAVYFTDWFKPKTLAINYTVRNQPQRAGAMPVLIFILNAEVEFTEIKVVPSAGFEANKNIVPLWHLVSDSNSVPLKAFSYGQMIHGMRPAIKGVRAEPLGTNVTYRLLVTAGKIKGERDFELK
jgi:hypothetical protein